MNVRPLKVDDLTVAYGAGPPVIDALSLPALSAGSITTLLGPNAAGKSTLLRGIAGLRRGSGQVRLGTTDVLRLSPDARARDVTYMPQALPAGVGLSVLEGLLGALSVGNPAAQGTPVELAMATLERLGILHLALSSLDRLSGGQKQLASLAQALVREPSVLLLDEPTSALDLSFQLRVMELVTAVARESGTVVLAVLHDLGLACRWSDQVVVLHRGRVAAAGAPADVLTPAILRDVYEVEASVQPGPGGHLQVTVLGRAPAFAGASSALLRENTWPA